MIIYKYIFWRKLKVTILPKKIYLTNKFCSSLFKRCKSKAKSKQIIEYDQSRINELEETELY